MLTSNGADTKGRLWWISVRKVCRGKSTRSRSRRVVSGSFREVSSFALLLPGPAPTSFPGSRSSLDCRTGLRDAERKGGQLTAALINNTTTRRNRGSGTAQERTFPDARIYQEPAPRDLSRDRQEERCSPAINATQCSCGATRRTQPFRHCRSCR